MLIRMQRAKITSVCCQALVLTQSSQQFRKIPSASTSLYIPENHGAQKLSKLLKFFGLISTPELRYSNLEACALISESRSLPEPWRPLIAPH